jgi:hypothetical protein
VAMAPTKQRRRGHDRGEVLVDLAVMVADGGEAISDLASLRDQRALFGEVASNPTARRTLEAVDEEALDRIRAGRAEARATAWAADADPGFYVIDIDATLIGSHSEKERAAPTYKRGFGYHPLLAYLDATGEALAAMLRPGNARSGTATDHVRGPRRGPGPAPRRPPGRRGDRPSRLGGARIVFIEACRPPTCATWSATASPPTSHRCWSACPGGRDSRRSPPTAPTSATTPR